MGCVRNHPDIMKKVLVSTLALLGIHQHLSAEQRQDLAVAAAQSAPGAVVSSSARIADLPLSDWAIVATIGFVALQAFYLIWKWRRDYLREIERKANGRPVPETGLGKLETDE